MRTTHPSDHFAGPLLFAATVVLPIVFGTGAPAGPAQVDDLPARATLSAQLLGTAEARLETCRRHHEAALIDGAQCAGRVAAAQTALAIPSTATPEGQP